MSTFTPVSTFDVPEKDWSMQLGMLDWDDTRIIFTKRELLNFLKYMGTTVDPNYNNVSKLPRYATFGKIQGNVNKTGTGGSAGGDSSSVTSNFVPTRRVREAPGGKSSIAFYDDDPQEDALGAAPPPPGDTSGNTSALTNSLKDLSVTEEPQVEEPQSEQPEQSAQQQQQPPIGIPGLVPSRRVRDPPGGKDSLKNFWD